MSLLALNNLVTSTASPSSSNMAHLHQAHKLRRGVVGQCARHQGVDVPLVDPAAAPASLQNFTTDFVTRALSPLVAAAPHHARVGASDASARMPTVRKDDRHGQVSTAAARRQEGRARPLAARLYWRTRNSSALVAAGARKKPASSCRKPASSASRRAFSSALRWARSRPSAAGPNSERPNGSKRGSASANSRRPARRRKRVRAAET